MMSNLREGLTGMMSQLRVGLTRYVLLWFCIFQLAQGSDLQFTATPTEFTEGLTSSVTLRCSLNDSSSSSAIVGRRDVTHTQNNMAQVASIIMMNDGQDVAAVSHSQPARQVGGNSSLHVTGSVAAGRSGRGFLEVILLDPAPSDIGEYRCEANAETSTGHVVTFSSTLEVSSTRASTDDLVKYIREMNTKMKDMDAKMKDMEEFNRKMAAKEDDTNRRLSEIENKTNTVSLFSVGLTTSPTISAGQTIIYDKVFTNIGNNYNTTTGQFVCSVTGYYQFAISARDQEGKGFRLELQLNHNEVIAIYEYSGNNYEGSSNSVIIKLTVGDIVEVAAHEKHTSYFSNGDSGRYTTFTGLLVAMI